MPFIGCDCPVCRSTNPRNHRLRCSLLLRDGDRRLLVDCGPDFRQQALRAGLTRLDAVLLTHAHADHLLGLDDLRLLIVRKQSPMPIYGTPESLETVRRIYPYAFAEAPNGSFRPRFELHELPLTAGPADVAGWSLTILPVEHSDVETIGLRLGDLAYLPDVKRIPEVTRGHLRGLGTLILDGLRPRPHATHLCVAEALAEIAALAPRQAFLTHLTHELDDDDQGALPAGVRLAYDGLVVPVSDA